MTDAPEETREQRDARLKEAAESFARSAPTAVLILQLVSPRYARRIREAAAAEINNRCPLSLTVHLARGGR